MHFSVQSASVAKPWTEEIELDGATLPKQEEFRQLHLGVVHVRPTQGRLLKILLWGERGPWSPRKFGGGGCGKGLQGPQAHFLNTKA